MDDDRYTFPRSRRLVTPRQFRTVYTARANVNVGPLRVHGCPNNLPITRLGLAIGKQVGNAVVRNRNKRLLREAFRHVQHDVPRGYDLVLSVRPHMPLAMHEYMNLLLDAAQRLEGIWNKRQAKSKHHPPDGRE